MAESGEEEHDDFLGAVQASGPVQSRTSAVAASDTEASVSEQRQVVRTSKTHIAKGAGAAETRQPNEDNFDNAVSLGSEKTVSVSMLTAQLLAKTRKEDESDDALIMRALSALETLSIVNRALQGHEARKACIVVQQMRKANFSEEMTAALCRAQFGEQSEKDMRKAFKFFDKDKSERLNKAEVEQALPLMGENVPKDKLDELMEHVDKNKNGEVDFDEFCALVRGMNPKGETNPDDGFAVFRNFSSNLSIPGSDFVSNVGEWSEGMLTSVKSNAEGYSASSSSAFEAVSRAWSADLKGLSPLEMRKAGVMLENMEKAGYNKAKAHQVVSSVLCDQTERNIKKTFQFFDKNGSGELELDEVKDALPLMGENVPPKLIKDLLKKVDTDNSGTISLKEFVTLVRGMNPKEAQENDGGFGASLRDAFGSVWNSGKE